MLIFHLAVVFTLGFYGDIPRLVCPLLSCLNLWEWSIFNPTVWNAYFIILLVAIANYFSANFPYFEKKKGYEITMLSMCMCFQLPNAVFMKFDMYIMAVDPITVPYFINSFHQLYQHYNLSNCWMSSRRQQCEMTPESQDIGARRERLWCSVA